MPTYTYKGKKASPLFPLPADQLVPGTIKYGDWLGNQVPFEGELRRPDMLNSPTFTQYPNIFGTPDADNNSALESLKAFGNLLPNRLSFKGLGDLSQASGEAIKGAAGMPLAWAAPTAEAVGDWATKSPNQIEHGRQQTKALIAGGKAMATGGDDLGKYFGLPTSDYVKNTTNFESGGKANAQNPLSSAGGTGQFVDQTWLHMVKQYGPKYGLAIFADKIQPDKNGRLQVSDPQARADILGMKYDGDLSTKFVGDYAAENSPKLTQALGRPPNNGELQLAHTLGPAGAIQILTAPPDTPAAALQPAFAAVNKNIYYKQDGTPRTAGEVAQIFNDQQGGNGMRWEGGKLVPPPRLAPPPEIGAPPEQALPTKTDYSSVEKLLAQMRPREDDPELTKRLKQHMLFAGLASGLQDNTHGISGMLAGMAAGGFKAKAAGDEFDLSRKDRYQDLLDKFLGTSINVGTRQAENVAEVANKGSEISFKNSWNKYDVKTKNAMNRYEAGTRDAENQWKFQDSLGRALSIQSLGGGAVSVSRIEDGKPVVEIQDISQMMPGLRQYGNTLGALAGGGGSGSGSLLPEALKKRVGQYQAAQLMGSPLGGFAALADEVLDSPYAGQLTIAGTPYAKILQEAKTAAAKAGLTSPTDVKDRAVGIVAAKLAEMAQGDRTAFNQELADYQKHGILTAQLMLGHALQH